MGRDVLLFAEDPGAANFLAPLPDALRERHIEGRFVGSGPALDHLVRLGARPLGGEETIESLLTEVRPSVVVVGTASDPKASGLEMIDIARERGIPSVGAIDAPVNADARFRGLTDEPLKHAPDWLLVPDAFTKQLYANLGFQASRVVVSGHPHYDVVRAFGAKVSPEDRARLKAKVFPNVDPRRPVLVFATEPAAGLNDSATRRSPEYTLVGREGSQLRTLIVLEEFLDSVSEIPGLPYVVLRVHPKDQRNNFSPYLDQVGEVSVEGPALELLLASDLVVGMTSILLTEALILGVPALSILPREGERDWLPTIALGLIPAVFSRKDIAPAMCELLNGGSLPPAGLVDELLPGGAAERAADLVARLVKSR